MMMVADEIALLRQAVHELTVSVKAERQARKQTLRVGVLAIIVVLILGGLIIRENRERVDALEDTIELMDRDRAESRLASCEGFNEQQQRSRDGNKAQIRAVGEYVRTESEPTPGEVAALERLYRIHDAAIDRAFPDRDCSPAGIRAYYADD